MDPFKNIHVWDSDDLTVERISTPADKEDATFKLVY